MKAFNLRHLPLLRISGWTVWQWDHIAGKSTKHDHYHFDSDPTLISHFDIYTRKKHFIHRLKNAACEFKSYVIQFSSFMMQSDRHTFSVQCLNHHQILHCQLMLVSSDFWQPLLSVSSLYQPQLAKNQGNVTKGFILTSL